VRIRWYGQSAFLLSSERTVFIDPFGDMSALAAARGMVFEYPPVAGVTADVLMVTHEHRDHNAVEAVGGDPVTIRSTAGRFDSPVGEVVAIASEHDDVAGTARGPNTIFRFELDGVRCCHLGDFGQRALRPEQRDAIGEVDVLFVPVGGGPTIGGEAAADLVRAISPRVVLPMHYRTPAVNFLEPPDEFIAALGMPSRTAPTSEVEVDTVEGVVLLAPPTNS
jgi:L-ascorbate metabolism protein UlaG (beta-lactamase superfamily)